jgi:hypothetical protein
MLKKTVDAGHFSRIRAELTNFVSGFVINDPTTPDLVSSVQLPSMGYLKYAVQGMSTSPKNTSEKRALNCHISIGSCINAIQALLKTPLQRWASVSSLSVLPAAGVDMNAYYDRRSLRFFYYNYGGKNTYFSDSADIVTHELGHAVLDSMRPDFWSVQALEIWSFHEAFSDIVAMFNLMNYDIVVNKVLRETNGNLRSSNAASRLAEEVGVLIRNVTRDPSYLPNALRDPAVELFTYADPSLLPPDAPNNKLAAECHSFGRVFSAAWYSAFVRTHEMLVTKGNDPVLAFKKARDMCFSTLLKAVPLSPRVNKYYSGVAKCVVSSAKDYGPELSKIFRDVFVEWKIIDASELRTLSSKSWGEVVVGLRRGDKVVKTKDGGALVSVRTKKTARISDLPMLSALNARPDLEVEIASDSYYEFDPSGRLVDEMYFDPVSALKDSAECVEQALSDGMWEDRGGKLVRKFIR